MERLTYVLECARILGASAWLPVRLSPAESDAGGAPADVPPGLAGEVEALFRLLNGRGVDYLLVGGVALLRYVPGRNTEDIDLIVAVEALGALPELQIEDRNDWFARARFGGLRVDLLFTANPLFETVRRRHATRHRFRELTVPCTTVDGLILLKLFALPSLYRQGNLQRANLYESDLAALLQLDGVAVEPLMEELRGHVSGSDLAELNKIVAEILARRTRFQGEAPGP